MRAAAASRSRPERNSRRGSFGFHFVSGLASFFGQKIIAKNGRAFGAGLRGTYQTPDKIRLGIWCSRPWAAPCQFLRARGQVVASLVSGATCFRLRLWPLRDVAGREFGLPRSPRTRAGPRGRAKETAHWPTFYSSRRERATVRRAYVGFSRKGDAVADVWIPARLLRILTSAAVDLDHGPSPLLVVGPTARDGFFGRRGGPNGATRVWARPRRGRKSRAAR